MNKKMAQEIKNFIFRLKWALDVPRVSEEVHKSLFKAHSCVPIIFLLLDCQLFIEFYELLENSHM